MLVNCNVCGSESKKIFDGLVLKKYKVSYFKCTSCKFIQTENPYWLAESYESAITELDIGLVSRNLLFAEVFESLLSSKVLPSDALYLDYAGGYGLFVRLMRDRGVNFYRQDVYCENIFAKHFDVLDLPSNQKFKAITAFEVFEHLVNPIEEVKKLLELSDVIMFSTLLQPDDKVSISNWWYFVPETGQHVSLYSFNSLLYLAESQGLNFYSDKNNLHIFSKHKFEIDPFLKKEEGVILNYLKRFRNKLLPKNTANQRESLLQKDFEYIKGMN
jgi:hypothetical protein